MNMAEWLSSLVVHTLEVDHYTRDAYALGRLPSVFSLSWDALERMLASDVDLLVVRDGRILNEPTPRTLADVEVLRRGGAGFVIRRAEVHDVAIAELCEELRERLNAAVTVQVFATARATYGFGWHYDAEDVFILQCQGHKEYRLRKNTVDPLASAPLPRNLHFERERTPVQRCMLAPEQLLHVPRGMWHMAWCLEDALSLSIGITQPSLSSATSRSSSCVSII